MKNQFIIALVFSILSGQFSINSLNGFGNSDRVNSPSSESMGGMWIYNSKVNELNPLLSSSLYKTDLTMIAIFSSFENIQSDKINNNSHLLNLVNFSFPINANTAIGFNLSPYTRSGYYLEDSEYSFIPGTEYSAPLASKNSYNIKGGISKLALLVSKSINNNVSLGIKWNVLFGNQEINRTSKLAEISYNQNEEKIYNEKEILYEYEYNHFNAYSYEIDSRINFNNNSFSFLINFLDNFTIDQHEIIQGFSNDNNYAFNHISLDELAIGYKYKINSNFGVAFESHLKEKIEYPKELMILNEPPPSYKSIHNGVYKIFNNTKADSWNTINLSSGYSYKLILFEESTIKDISFSLGLGVLFNNQKNNIDFSFTIGSRGSIIKTIDKENYYKLNIAIISGDKWFTKRRRD